MVREEFERIFWLFVDVIASDGDDVVSYAPSAHLIDHCGGYELELRPSRLMWDREIICLSAIADKLCLSLECRFYDGSIIIR